MARSRLSRYQQTLKHASYIAPALAVVIITLAAGRSYGQSNPPLSTFRPGQSMYIVAFRQIQFPIILDEVPGDRQREYINNDLDAERNGKRRELLEVFHQ